MAVVISELPKVLSNGVSHTIEPMWSKNAGRNSNSGTFSGTFNGWYDTLEVKIGTTTYEEMSTLRSEIEVPTLDVTFLDTRTNQERTSKFYGTAITATRKNSKKYQPTTFKLVAIKKRSDM